MVKSQTVKIQNPNTQHCFYIFNTGLLFSAKSLKGNQKVSFRAKNRINVGKQRQISIKSKVTVIVSKDRLIISMCFLKFFVAF